MHYGWLRGGNLSAPIYKNNLTLTNVTNFGTKICRLNCLQCFSILVIGCYEKDVKYETGDTSDGKKLIYLLNHHILS